MEKERKIQIIKISVSAVFFAAGAFLPWEIPKTVLLLLSYLAAGYSVILEAFENLIHGEIFDENFLMLTATVGAIILGEYPEAAAVMLLYQLGELFEDAAVDRSRDSVNALLELTAEYANITVGGELRQVSPEEVRIGDEITVLSGERFPLDGMIVKGNTFADTSPLTGESLPKELHTGDTVLSGFINNGEAVKVKVTSEFENSTAKRIMYLVQEAENKKAKAEGFITRFSKYYTPAVVAAAVLLAVIPSVITHEYAKWISRALLLLVVSCPCALVISVPLCFFCSIGKASREGILIKGSNFLEILGKADTAVFDKTGTLTKGKFKVIDIVPFDTEKEDLLEICAYAEGLSEHPLAKAVREAYGKEINTDKAEKCEQIPGMGVCCVISGKNVLAGNRALMEKYSVKISEDKSGLTAIYVSVDGKFCGYITVADEIKPESREALSRLKKLGITKTCMLTGDNEKIGKYVGEKLGIDEIFTGLLPGDKVEKLKKIKNSAKYIMYAGDGMNDAPVLAVSDVGIAMGAMGSDAAIEAADAVIMDDDIGKLEKAVLIGKKTLKTVKQNIVFALSVKFVIMVLGVLGIANMWLAVFADVGVTLLAILNSMRNMK